MRTAILQITKWIRGMNIRSTNVMYTHRTVINCLWSTEWELVAEAGGETEEEEHLRANMLTNWKNELQQGSPVVSNWREGENNRKWKNKSVYPTAVCCKAVFILHYQFRSPVASQDQLTATLNERLELLRIGSKWRLQHHLGTIHIHTSQVSIPHHTSTKVMKNTSKTLLYYCNRIICGNWTATNKMETSYACVSFIQHWITSWAKWKTSQGPQKPQANWMSICCTSFYSLQFCLETVLFQGINSWTEVTLKTNNLVSRIFLREFLTNHC